jgi:AcrR family transcriptional regulator
VDAAPQDSRTEGAIAGAPDRSISRRALYDRVWATPMTVVAEDLKMSRNGLAKICDRLLIPYPGRGYWTKPKSAPRPARPPLPPPPAGGANTVVIASGRSKSRRRRTRMSPEARAEQLVEAAGQIVAKEGLAAATMKRVAREVGISEAQAHNYYPRRDDLLVALARRELTAMDSIRLTEAQRGQDNFTRVTLSTITYLRQVSERGTLIQTLLNSPQVRAGLRAERVARVTSARAEMTDRLSSRYGVERDTAYGATVILTGVTLRAGRLLAERKIPLEMAERLSLAIVTSGNRRVVGAKRRRD